MQLRNSVFVVGFEKDFSDAFKALLNFYDIGVDAYPDGISFLVAAQNVNLDDCCILVSSKLPDQSGLSLLKLLNESGCKSPVILVMDKNEASIRREAVALGATDVIEQQVAGAYIFAQLSNLLQGPVELPHTPDTVKTLADGVQVTFRMLRPDDAEMEQSFVVALSNQSRYLRFFSGLKQLTPYMLEELTNPIYPVSYALIATTMIEGHEHQIAVGRYSPTGTEGLAEFAVVVADDWHGRGIAGELMRFVITAAAVGGIKSLEGLVLRENTAMLRLAKKFNFKQVSGYDEDPTIVHIIRHLTEKPDDGAVN